MPSDLTPPLLPLPDSDEILIPSRQMPFYVGVSTQTLARWRHEGKGPEYVKIGRLVAYSAGTVRLWLDQMRRAATGERTARPNGRLYE